MSDWKYFNKSEFKCKCGCGTDNIDPELVDLLDEARFKAGVPFKITSGCRCPEHNKRIGGKPDSAHVTTELQMGQAVDIRALTSSERFKILEALFSLGFKRIGIHKTFIHADIDIKKPEQVTWIY